MYICIYSGLYPPLEPFLFFEKQLFLFDNLQKSTSEDGVQTMTRCKYQVKIRLHRDEKNRREKKGGKV